MIVKEALKWLGKEFRPNERAQCMYWVCEVLKNIGMKEGEERWSYTGWCPDAAGEISPGVLDESRAWGTAIYSIENLIPGDIILFDRTYRDATLTHVGIYIGEGNFIHRSTSSRPISIANINAEYWRSRFNHARRFNANESNIIKKKIVDIWINMGKNNAEIKFANGEKHKIKHLTMRITL